ncbi:MAG: hypothetical protein IH905_10380 [Proteobacteria bacterium]|nr:hypothetical protein [Pseudomonadota bacterium]
MWRWALSATLASLLSVVGRAAAGEWDFSASVAAELRAFPNTAAFVAQEAAGLSPSLVAEPEVVYEWNDGDDRLTFVPFLRWDAHDDNRTHADLREANWLHLGTDWTLLVGIGKVFWGVTESRHLVDIINQTDSVEDIDTEDKLGQPMVNLDLNRDWGTLSIFVLPGFRERTFPDREARLRGSLPIDKDNPTYESRAKERHVDVAVRWAQSIGNWDVGLAHFHGTSREPRLLPSVSGGGQNVLRPRYDQIDQTSLDLQLTIGAWLLKLEAITRGGQGDRFAAAVGGFEYTFFGVAGTNADVGLLAEYLYDGRNAGSAPSTASNNDMFLGVRLALNDEPDTQLLMGAIVDRSSGATLFNVEAERRLGENWKLEIESRFLFDVADDPVLAGIGDDDFITFRLTRFF